MERRSGNMFFSARFVLVLLYFLLMIDTVITNCLPGFTGTTCKKQNIALNKSTRQISTYTEPMFTYFSHLAVDGNTDTNSNISAGRTCSVTYANIPSWWYVLLDKKHNITQMTIYLRASYGDRYQNMKVYVDNHLCKYIPITVKNNTAPSPNPVHMAGCNEPLRGNNVSIHVNNSYLTLCEVQIWVCSDGWFGENCTVPCNCMNSSEICDKVTGYCRSGCASGWQGNGCQTECIDGTYGENCTHHCGRCGNNTACNKVNGSCSDGCQDGYSFPHCKELISAGSSYDPVGGIVGGVMAAVLAVVAVGLGTVFYLRRKKQLIRNQDDSRPEDAYATINDNKGNAYDTLELDSNTANTYTSLSREGDLKNYIRNKLSNDGFENEFTMLHHDDMIYENTVWRKDQSWSLDSGIRSTSRAENVIPLSVPYTRCLYTAAEDPTDTAADEFWKMIWERKVKRIVMLTAPAETKQFWPEENGRKDYGDIIIQTISITARASFSIRKFEMTHESRRRQVTQFHFMNWTQHNFPPTPSFVSFLKLTRVNRDGNVQVLVHSQSRGHISVFITLDSLMTQFERKYDTDVFQSIAELMQTPEYCLTSADQYKYVHEVLLETLESYGTFYTQSEFDQKYGTGLTYTTQQEEELKQQFEALSRMNKELSQEIVSDGLLPENQAKNRNQSILPANRSRPFLPDSVTGMNDYINAVYLPSHRDQTSFLVTQTPMENTVKDFWRLVYYQNCDIIVCLDDSKDALLLYPRVNTSTGVDNFHIETVEKVAQFEEYTQLLLELSQKDQNDSRLQIQLYQAQEMELTSRELLSTIMSIASQITSVNSENERKVLIHCHDGSNKSGLFCSVMNIISRLNLDKEVDIFLTIRELQTIRPQFVHSFAQYKFCYDVAKEYIRSASIDINESV